jgi:hypothetical protein
MVTARVLRLGGVDAARAAGAMGALPGEAGRVISGELGRDGLRAQRQRRWPHGGGPVPRHVRGRRACRVTPFAAELLAAAGVASAPSAAREDSRWPRPIRWDDHAVVRGHDLHDPRPPPLVDRSTLDIDTIVGVSVHDGRRAAVGEGTRSDHSSEPRSARGCLPWMMSLVSAGRACARRSPGTHSFGLS